MVSIKCPHLQLSLLMEKIQKLTHTFLWMLCLFNARCKRIIYVYIVSERYEQNKGFLHRCCYEHIIKKFQIFARFLTPFNWITANLMNSWILLFAVKCFSLSLNLWPSLAVERSSSFNSGKQTKNRCAQQSPLATQMVIHFFLHLHVAVSYCRISSEVILCYQSFRNNQNLMKLFLIFRVIDFYGLYLSNDSYPPSS